MDLEVEIIGENLEGTVDGKPLWSVPIAAIFLIAEYTTNQGPWLDDWYLLLNFVQEGRMMEVRIRDSVIGGPSVLLRALADRLNAPLAFGLVSSSVWDSRVMWPQQLKDVKYFTLDPITPVGIGQMLKKLCFGPSLSLALTQPVRDYLRQYEIQAREPGVSKDGSRHVPGLQPSDS